MRKTTLSLGLAGVALASTLAVAAPAQAAPTSPTTAAVAGASVVSDPIGPRPRMRDFQFQRRSPFQFNRRSPRFIHRRTPFFFRNRVRPVFFNSDPCQIYLAIGDVQGYLFCLYGGDY